MTQPNLGIDSPRILTREEEDFQNNYLNGKTGQLVLYMECRCEDMIRYLHQSYNDQASPQVLVKNFKIGVLSDDKLILGSPPFELAVSLPVEKYLDYNLGSLNFSFSHWPRAIREAPILIASIASRITENINNIDQIDSKFHRFGTYIIIGDKEVIDFYVKLEREAEIFRVASILGKEICDPRLDEPVEKERKSSIDRLQEIIDHCEKSRHRETNSYAAYSNDVVDIMSALSQLGLDEEECIDLLLKKYRDRVVSSIERFKTGATD